MNMIAPAELADARSATPPLLPEEAAVALCFDGAVQAVMMATPEDLGDFMAGFALTEGITRACPEPEVVHGDRGIELRVWLDGADRDALRLRRRAMLGPVGCGLCGIDSLAQALRAPQPVSTEVTLCRTEIDRAERALRASQPLRDRTGALHAAGFWLPGRGMAVVREDVGRHNALDKLAGAMMRAGIDAAAGAVVLTSRVSVDLVQKAAAMGTGTLLAVSAPTRLAVETAEAANLTLVTGIGRAGATVHAHPRRILS